MIHSTKAVQFVLTLSLYFAGPSMRGDETSTQRVKLEYPRALAKLQARYNSMHGQALCHEYHQPKDQTAWERTLKLDYAFSPQAARMVITASDPKDHEIQAGRAPYQSVSAANSKYGFSLSRGRPEDELALRKLYDDPVLGLRQVGSRHTRAIKSAITFSFWNLSKSFGGKNCRVTSVSELTGALGEKQLLIRIAYIYDSAVTKIGDMDVDGWIVVEPDEGWIIRESGGVHTQHTKSGKLIWTDITKIDYARSPDGYLDPIKLKMRELDGRVDRDANISESKNGFDLDFVSVKYEELPESEFRLPKFGMPEVDPEIKKGATAERPYALFALAGVGFGLAGGLKYMASRRKQS